MLNTKMENTAPQINPQDGSSQQNSSQNVFQVIPAAKAAPGLSQNPLPGALGTAGTTSTGSSGPMSSAPKTPAMSPSSAPGSSPASGLSPKKFLSGKLLAAVIAVFLLGGGIAAGYFIFPEPFYNTIGKYIGLPAPGGAPEAKEDKKEESGETAGTETANASMIELFKELPGEDANILIALRPTQELKTELNPLIGELYQESTSKVFGTSIEDIRKYLLEGRSSLIDQQIEEKKMYQFLNSLEEIAVVMKIDDMAPKSTKKLQLAIAARIPKEQQNYLLIMAEDKKEYLAKENIIFAMKENGIGTWVYNKNDLSGTVRDNVLFKNFQSQLQAHFAMAMNAEDIKKYFPEIPGVFVAPMSVMSVSMQKEGDAIKVAGKMIDFMKDEESAAALLERNQEATKKIPEEFKELIEMKVVQEKNVVTTDLTVKDLKALGEKLIDTMATLDETSRLPEPFIEPGKIKRPR